MQGLLHVPCPCFCKVAIKVGGEDPTGNCPLIDRSLLPVKCALINTRHSVIAVYPQSQEVCHTMFTYLYVVQSAGNTYYITHWCLLYSNSIHFQIIGEYSIYTASRIAWSTQQQSSGVPISFSPFYFVWCCI